MKRKGFILMTSIGLSSLITIYAVGVFPIKQQAFLTMREERRILEHKIRLLEYRVKSDESD